MDYLVPVLTILLSAVFLTAGIAKLIDFEAAKKAGSEFGIPANAAGPAMAALVVFEVATALALLFARTNRIASAAACGVLFVFLVATARLLLQGKTPECRCFGQLSNEPVGKSSLVRNALLLVAAGLVLVFHRDFSVTGGAENTTASIIVATAFALSALLIASLLIALELRGQFDSIEARLQKIERFSTLLEMQESGGDPMAVLPVGTLVPDVSIINPNGEPVPLRSLQGGDLPVLFVFIEPDCIPCADLSVQFPMWLEKLEGKVRLVLISSGDERSNIEKFGEAIRDHLYLQEGTGVSEALRSRWTPSAVLVGPNGRVASGPTAGDDAIRELVEQIAGTDSFENPLFIGGELGGINSKFGQAVPEFTLSKLDGQTFTLADLTKRETMVVFWSLTCQYCTEMLEEMRGWHIHPEGLDVVIFADGDEAKLNQTGLGSRIVVDSGYKIAETMGMYGTPSAVIVDTSGIVVSETVDGGPKIQLLAGGAFDADRAHDHSGP